MFQSSIAEPFVAADEGPVEPVAKAQVMTFRGFEIFPTARQLIRDQCEVEIGGRAFDLLIVLLEARGCLVEKQLILKKVWPSTIVDESNLRFQMAQLRKTLGCDGDLIKTIPGRGYLLADELPTHPLGAEQQRTAPLPSRLSAEEEILALRAKNLELVQALAKLAMEALAFVANAGALTGLEARP